MDAKVRELLELIEKNHGLIRKQMFWEIASNYTAIMNAYINAAKGCTADPAKYVECKKLLKKHVSVFSEFRGIGRSMVITKMALEDDPETYVKGCMEVYKKLRSIHKIVTSPYMVMAAMTIYEHGGVEGADANIEKLETFYKRLKKDHPLLITDEDRGYLSMLVTCGANLDVMAEKIESCYQACKPLSINKNGVNSLAQIMSLSGNSSAVCAEQAGALLKGLKAAKCPISNSYGLGALGALALIDRPIDEKIAVVTELCEEMKQYKAFKWYNMGKRTRTMFAALITFIAYSEDIDKSLADTVGGTITMVIVEEIIIAIIILLCTSSASSAASSSSSGGN